MSKTNTAAKLEEDKIDSSVNSVHVTKDYGKFNFNSKNRHVNPAHKDNLVESIEQNNLLEAQPITINADFEIIDGQHRFIAAKELGLPIYYIKVDRLEIDDAITLNINTRNWRYKDYLLYWIAQGKEEYTYFKKFMDQYGFGYAVSLALLGLGQADKGQKLTDIFNAGKFVPKYRDYAEDMGQKVKQLEEYGKFVTTRSFMLAFDKVMQMDEFNFDEFLRKVKQTPGRFQRRADVDHYLRMLEQVYNYNRHGKNVRFY
ncbi:ParB-like nuclease domain-containing protein [Fodinibius salinus]|uniref:ParB-like nuclease domain-containing protein n=1 Tax=Fodinibius salinus TaxID=860790 RepID=A0A5D3YIJ6_9BACT|nr:ParB N-terminal domain-containing protein [Fodinibius salinus]TYP92060.1 ParB-like nuclease domain-containing protein [Fodinibius salinus]